MKKFWFYLGMALLLVCWGTEGYRGLGTCPAYSQETQRGEGYQQGEGEHKQESKKERKERELRERKERERKEQVRKEQERRESEHKDNQHRDHEHE
jgi:hypothetical protein